jgi:hypothetical protein
VRSDAGRILTCVLEYEDAHVVVHDLLHEFDGAAWRQRVSSYDGGARVAWIHGAALCRECRDGLPDRVDVISSVSALA